MVCTFILPNKVHVSFSTHLSAGTWRRRLVVSKTSVKLAASGVADDILQGRAE